MISETILFHILGLGGRPANIKEGFKYLNYYNLTLDDLDKLVKMNKLTDDHKTKQSKKPIIKKLKDQYEAIYGVRQQRLIPKLMYMSKIANVAELDEVNDDDD